MKGRRAPPSVERREISDALNAPAMTQEDLQGLIDRLLLQEITPQPRSVVTHASTYLHEPTPVMRGALARYQDRRRTR